MIVWVCSYPAAIRLVRDGRDAVVSWARLLSEVEPDRFAPEMRAPISRRDSVGTGSCGRDVLSWLRPPAPLRYEDLVATPRADVERVLTTVAPHLRPLAGARIPSFDELRGTDDRCVHRGRAGSHRDEMPADLHALFSSRPGYLPGGAARATARREQDR